MPTCLVIQPFDSGRFDKRCDEIFKPALEQVGLEAYRVDRDPSVAVTIDSIEDRIRTATLCLADITTDNPNVWYELGYAFASNRSVILVCADSRTNKYPFDIQHRPVIEYGTESPSDYDGLRSRITERARALFKSSTAQRIVETEQVAPQDGLSQIEIMVLAVAAGSTSIPGTPQYADSLKHDVESSGLTGVGYGVAITRLKNKGLIEISWEQNDFDNPTPMAAISVLGWKWIEANERLFTVVKSETRGEEFEDEIPF